MDQDFYFEESNPKKVRIIMVVIFIIISALCIALLYCRSLYTLNVKKEVIYEAGSKISYDVADYVTNKVVDESDYTLLFSAVTMDGDILNKVGEYTYKVKYKNITKAGKIIVKDTIIPDVEVQNLTVGVGEEYELDEFITKCVDYSSPCLVTYENESDEKLNQKEGTYAFNIIISDSVGNKVTKEVKLTAKKGFNLTGSKESDLTVNHIEPEFTDWDKTMILKFSKAYDPNEIDETDVYGELLDITGSDLHNYIDPIYANNAITDYQIIWVYNKYGYVIGFAIRIKLDNGLYLYLKNN